MLALGSPGRHLERTFLLSRLPGPSDMKSGPRGPGPSTSSTSHPRRQGDECGGHGHEGQGPRAHPQQRRHLSHLSTGCSEFRMPAETPSSPGACAGRHLWLLSLGSRPGVELSPYVRDPLAALPQLFSHLPGSLSVPTEHPLVWARRNLPASSRSEHGTCFSGETVRSDRDAVTVE